MRKARLAAAAVTVSLLGASASTGIAAAQTAPAGVGTSKASTTVLNIELGDLLKLRLLGDDGLANIDPKVNRTSEASSRLVPLTIDGVLGKHEIAPVEARSTGAEQKSSLPATNLPLPAVVGSGSISAGLLNAVVDQEGARSGLNAAVKDLKLAQGSILDLPSLTSNLGTNALKPNANGLRGIKLDKLELLDLGALLDALGAKNLLNQLPVSNLTGMLGKLNLKIVDPENPGKLLDAAAVDKLVDDIVGVLGTPGADNTLKEVAATAPETPLSGLVDPLEQQVTDLLGTDVPATTPVTDLIEQVTELLNDLVSNLVTTLDGTRLLSLNGLEVGLNTKAANTVANSDAGTTVKLGSITVGGVTIPGADLGGALSTATGLVNQVLGLVNSALGNMLQLQAVNQTKSVKQNGEYVNAVAGITGLVAKIVPPANLSSILAGLTGGGAAAQGVKAAAVSPTDPSAESLGVTPSTPSAAAIGNLPAALASVLSKGAAITVGQASAESAYALPVVPAAAPAKPVPSRELAYTGLSSGMVFTVSLLMIAAAGALFGWVRRSGSPVA